jgi:uncharacterized protein with GYD domain
LNYLTEGDDAMARYAMLIQFTDQGIANIQQSPKRAKAFKAAAKKAGVEVESLFWTLGAYDGLVVLNAPDESTAVALALKLGSLGNVRTTMLRAFDAAEFKGILEKV